ncbi:hypothetical protein [Acidithiobacillus thiooxidans]|uniref:Uncharacterized protein n=3 Tax=Acidithiobacillus TaxID=119977 RepID=A0A2I1DK78_9PROT|nr:hypothetical protein [Acidithiobacillus thiooxidans]MDX5935189.1 hypothetical protein [Acidithiobacillus thiooxidans]PKY10282.1 hypothetical protein B1757_10440 [Acidithiobacillus marinus]TQN50675.1 hypothetical protein DLNHIDIE_00530 [Acidithiobacillus thiooxidans ATCC 19377]
MKTHRPTIRSLYITGSIYLAGMLFVIVMGAHCFHLHLPLSFGWLGLGILGNFVIAYPAGMIWHAFRSKQFDWEIGHATQAYWVCATKIAKAAVTIPGSMRTLHQQTFPKSLLQKGSVGVRLNGTHARGRQSGKKCRGGGQSAKKASSDDPGGDAGGEPPRTVPPCFLSFADLAHRWACSEKTLRNQVCLGKLPAPHKLPIGPRFPIGVIEQIEQSALSAKRLSPNLLPSYPQVPVVPSPRRRGRPRIISRKKGGDL